MKTSLLLIILCIQMIHSQNMDSTNDIQKLVDLGRDHIIALALEEIQQDGAQEITADDFHFVKVMASDQRILVSFGYNILYLPKNSSYYTDILVEFPSKFDSKTSESNDSKNTTFYHPTPEHLNVINFIMNPNGTNTDIFHKGISSSPTIIYQKEKHYLVDFSSRDPYLGGSFSTEEIDKETGEVLSTLSGHYEPAPIFPEDTIDQEEFIEIKN